MVLHPHNAQHLKDMSCGSGVSATQLQGRLTNIHFKKQCALRDQLGADYKVCETVGVGARCL